MAILHAGRLNDRPVQVQWASFLGWPVYYCGGMHEFAFEIGGYYLVTIRREDEGMIVFEPPSTEDLPGYLLALLGRGNDDGGI